MASTEAISEEIKMSTRASYTVNYNSSSHFSVITQMWGSTWPKVLPYCIFNVGLMALLIWLDEKFGKTFVIELSTQEPPPSRGHPSRRFWSQQTTLGLMGFFSDPGRVSPML
eukprot:scaffold2476_cov193-Amphora_coffeaeformis.AAC.8